MHWRTHIGRYGTAFMPGEPWSWRLFWALMALAALVRFWQLPDLPYTHDEISGLLRVGYPTFGQLIRDGVAIDAHPPGVAVFLHYWTMIFGFSEAAVKTPFILASLAALFLLYRFALAWSNGSVALITIAFLATVQYTVVYAQIARPYAAGFFTCALLVDQWTRWLAGGANARRALEGTTVGLVLSAYMHHFALLFAAMVAVSGLFLTDRTRIKPYITALVIAGLAYLPNIPIFLKQLSYGGVGQWLAPPDRYWIVDHLAWCVQYMPTMALLLLGLGIIAAVQRWKGGHHGPFLRLTLLWWIFPFVIGLSYSIWIDPVIQYSVLLFSFPFLLMALLHGLPELEPRWTVAITLATAGLGSTGLAQERRHFELFRTSKYEAIIEAGRAAIARYGEGNVRILVDAPDEAIAFMQRIRRIPPEGFPHVQLRRGNVQPHALDSLLRADAGKVIVYGCSNGARPETSARIQRRFPRLIQRRDLLEGQVMVFADRPMNDAAPPDRRMVAWAQPDGSHNGHWELHADLPVISDSAGATLWDYSGREYGVSGRLRLDTIVGHAQDQFDVMAHLQVPAGTTNVGVVVELRANDSTHFYRTGELDVTGAFEGRSTLIVSAHPGDTRLRHVPIELIAYVHNRQQAPLFIERMEVMQRYANPFQYGLFEPVPRQHRKP